MNVLSVGRIVVALLLLGCAVPSAAVAQTTGAARGVDSEGVEPPADYLIGVEDVLTLIYWREKDLSAEAVVRPDGKISLPLVNDVQAAGLTPEQLRATVTKAAAKFVQDPSVTVVVKQINSRRVYVTGLISKPGPYPLGGPTTVLQLIAMAGGVHEYADRGNISILRNENGQQSTFRFNYEDMEKRRRLEQNILLKPGDTVVIP